MLPRLPSHILNMIEGFLVGEFETLCCLRESCALISKHIECPDFTHSNDWSTFIICIESLCQLHFNRHTGMNIFAPIDVVRHYHFSEGYELMSTAAAILDNMPSYARRLAFEMFSDVLFVICEHLRPCTESYIHFQYTLHCLEYEANTKTY